MCSKLIGKNPLEIERIWQRLHRSFFRGGPINGTVISGIEMALWDIKGKALNLPVYELLGGAVRDKIKVYSWIGGDRPSDVVAMAQERWDKGFRAVKMNATSEMHYVDSLEKVDAAVKRVASIREKFGNAMSIGIDFHGRVHKPMAKVLAKALKNTILCSLKNRSYLKMKSILLKFQMRFQLQLQQEKEYTPDGVSKIFLNREQLI